MEVRKYKRMRSISYPKSFSFTLTYKNIYTSAQLFAI